MFDRAKRFVSVLGKSAPAPTATPVSQTTRRGLPQPSFQGYVDERSTTYVMGWVRNLPDPTERVAFEIVVDLAEGRRVIGGGVADQFSPTLQQLSVGDAHYAFRVDFPRPLTPVERDHLVVCPLQSDVPLELAPQLQGFLDERSTHHVAGWIRHRSDPDQRVEFEVMIPHPDGDIILARGRADQYSPVLTQLSIGDGAYAFAVVFQDPLSEEERDQVIVRATGTDFVLPLAPALRTTFEPISHIAMDIVNNCNLRCPFCVYDYADVRHTRVMSDATFESALRFIPFVTDGNFWLSCEHEATMHPALMQFIERIPRHWRHKVMYTTNLARPMPDAYFDLLANSGIHHLNVSLESLDPALYERMRKGARWRIFAKNWDTLLDAFRRGSAPPKLRYNIMAYRSNLAEIPDLVRHLRQERQAWQVEIRHTFDVAHIPTDFKQSEFLDDAGWAWLENELRFHAPEDVLLIPPPEADPPAMQPSSGSEAAGSRFVTRPLNLRLQWDGRLIVYGEWTGLTGLREHEQFIVTNVHHLRDPRQFICAL